MTDLELAREALEKNNLPKRAGSLGMHAPGIGSTICFGEKWRSGFSREQNSEATFISLAREGGRCQEDADLYQDCRRGTPAAWQRTELLAFQFP